MAITNKEILEEIEFLKKKLPNGEFALLKKSVEDLIQVMLEEHTDMK